MKIIFWLFILSFFSLKPSVSASILEATVASVEDEVITLGELNERYETMKKRFPQITRREVLDAMINRSILLREARLSRIAGSRSLLPLADEDRVIDEYIEIKIRSSVRIPEEEVQEYYESHRSDFKGMPFQDVAERIEELLTEKKTNELLTGHLKDLRKKYYIYINGELLSEQP